MVSGWTESINQHPTVGFIRQLADSLPGALAAAQSPGAIDQIKRSQAIVRSFQDALRRPEYMTLLGLESANADISNALQDIGGFAADGDEGRLSRANSYLDKALFQMPYRVPLPRRESQTLLDEARSFAEDVQRLHQSQKEKSEALAGELDAMRQELSNVDTKLQEKLAELTSASETAQQSVMADAQTRTEQLAKDIDRAPTSVGRRCRAATADISSSGEHAH